MGDACLIVNACSFFQAVFQITEAPIKISPLSFSGSSNALSLCRLTKGSQCTFSWRDFSFHFISVCLCSLLCNLSLDAGVSETFLLLTATGSTALKQPQSALLVRIEMNEGCFLAAQSNLLRMDWGGDRLHAARSAFMAQEVF